MRPVTVQGPVGYVPVPVSSTKDILVQNDEYELIGDMNRKVNTVDRRRRRSSAGVNLRRRSVGAVDRDRRPVSYQNVGGPWPGDSVARNSSGYLNDTPDRVKSM